MSKVLNFSDVNYVRNGRAILDGLNWSVAADQRWVILGPNGAGKSTILKLASAADHPTSGSVQILDETLGKVDIFELRTRIGVATRAQELRIPHSEKVRDVILTAAYSIAGRWRENYDDLDVRQANRVLQEWGLESLAERTFGTLSDGERKRTMIARAVMTDPELLLLDEPAANIDLGGRERLVATLSGFARSEFCPAMVMVTHHVEEIPTGFTHILLLGKNGKPVAQGPLAEVLTSYNLSATFSLPLQLSRVNDRYFASAVATQ